MKYLLKSDSGVGIAAPQVFQPLRLFVMKTIRISAFPDTATSELFTVINPEILKKSEGQVEFYENCKNFPEMRGIGKTILKHRS